MTRVQRLTAVLSLCSLAALVPPVGATALHRWRVASTRARADRALAAVAGMVQGHDAGSAVRCLSQRRPDVPRETLRERGLEHAWTTHAAWLARIAPADSGPDDVGDDAWGHCFLAVVVRGPGGTWHPAVLSAGGNGVVETALGSAEAGGDDLLRLGAPAVAPGPRE